MQQPPIHHVGMITSDIKAMLSYYKKLGFEVDETIYIDEYQKVRVGKVLFANGVMIELLEPLNDQSPIYKSSKGSTTYHHICYQVEDIDRYLAYIRAHHLGFRVSEKTPSVFEGKLVCFFANKDKQLFELIEVKT